MSSYNEKYEVDINRFNEFDNAMIASIAISLKRIADKLEVS